MFYPGWGGWPLRQAPRAVFTLLLQRDFTLALPYAGSDPCQDKHRLLCDSHPLCDAEREFPLHWYGTRGRQGLFGRPAVSSIRAFGEEPKFSGGAGDHRTPIFAFSAAELTLYRDQGWRSGVTEAGSKKTCQSQGSQPLLLRPSLKGYRNLRAHSFRLQEQRRYRAHSGGHLGVLERRKTQRREIILLPSSCWWLKRSGESCEQRHAKIKRIAPGHPVNASHHIA